MEWRSASVWHDARRLSFADPLAEREFRADFVDGARARLTVFLVILEILDFMMSARALLAGIPAHEVYLWRHLMLPFAIACLWIPRLRSLYEWSIVGTTVLVMYLFTSPGVQLEATRFEFVTGAANVVAVFLTFAMAMSARLRTIFVALSAIGTIGIALEFTWRLVPDPTKFPFFVAMAGVAIVAVVIGTSQQEVAARERFWALRELAQERDRSDRLLHTVLPGSLIERLRQGERFIAERHEGVVILFADIVGFTELANRIEPEQLVALLDQVFGRFDSAVREAGAEKIKTIGDAYLAAIGLGTPSENASVRSYELAVSWQKAIQEVSELTGQTMRLRVGIARGPVIAGVFGESRFAYDVWGPAVNLASRLQTAAQPGGLVLAKEIALELNGIDTESQTLNLKGFGEVEVFSLSLAR